jgi:hypothetical protein
MYNEVTLKAHITLLKKEVLIMTCGERPRSKVAIVDKSYYNMYCVKHFDLPHSSHSTLKDRASENWGAYTKGFSRGE